MEPEQSKTGASTKIDGVDIQPLLRRFAEALAVVNAGLATLTAGQPAPAAEANAGASGPVSLPRAAELAELLAHNDTRAETVMAEIRASWSGAEPTWLAAAARAIETLDYQGALQRLREAGAIGGAT